MKRYTFTVFVPAYNRAHTLKRLLASLEAQTYRDFECIIVDDGSTDTTRDLVEEESGRVAFPLTYYYQQNSGKHVARNHALRLAQGAFFVTLDSDDILLPSTLERMKYYIDRVPPLEASRFAGVEGVSVAMANREQTIGSLFPKDVMYSDYITTRFVHAVFGDKNRCIKTSVFREFPFPVTEGEKFITEGIVWSRLACAGYKFVYVNEPFEAKEYLAGGLSDRSRITRAKNPRGARLYYDEFIRVVARQFGVRKRFVLRYYANWVRYSLHIGVSIAEQSRSTPSMVWWLLALPIGCYLWRGDVRLLRTNK